jgi:glycosyltransferase involved in cell wall biosynthesis
MKNYSDLASSERPLFSIVIPTRNSSNTLRHTLTSCLSQSFQDYEIVVADNASTDDTNQMILKLDHAKIKYSHRAEPLSMTENWNWALSLASGEWIIFLGSDDGIRSRSLEKLKEKIDQHPVLAINWSQAIYTWPNFPDQKHSNKLSIPPITPNSRALSTFDSAKDFFNGEAYGTGTPIYYGAVNRKLIELGLESGPIFQGRSPDLYSSALFTALTELHVYIEDPLTVTGLSARSNGVANLQHFESSIEIKNDFAYLNLADKVQFHRDVPDVWIKCAVIWDALFRVNERTGAFESQCRISKRDILRKVLVQIAENGFLENSDLAKLQEYSQLNGVDLVIPVFSESPRFVDFLPLEGIPSRAGLLYLIETKDLTIDNVYSACDFIDKVEAVYSLLIMGQSDLELRVNLYESQLLDLKSRLKIAEGLNP